MNRRAVIVGAALALISSVLACNPTPTDLPSPRGSTSSPPESRATGAPSPPRVIDVPAPLVDPTPSDPTPEQVIDRFLALVRPGTLSFHLSIAGSYAIGAHKVDYELEGARGGQDVMVSGTQTSDGDRLPFGWAFVGNRLYAQAGGPWSSATEDVEAAAQFGSFLYRLDNTLVLGDLGKEAVGGSVGYRLRVTTAMSLYPPAFVDGTIVDPRDATDRIELVVDERGSPVEATYTRSVKGTIDGVDSVAAGSVAFTFTDVGKDTTIAAPVLSPDASLPPLVPTRTAGPPVDWQTYLPEAGGFGVQFPDDPVVTSSVQKTQAFGDVTVRIARVASTTGPRLSVIDGVLPDEYVATHSLDELLDRAGQASAIGVEAQIVGRRFVTVEGVHGIEFLAASKTGVYRIREFMIGNRSVEISVVGNPTEVATADMDRFLGSLEVVWN